MAEVTHQTARLSPGRHRSPEHGTCVMELASMLAGEPFTDRPRTVCPVVATVLRTYNDVVDDVQRQDLYRYAAESVGTRDRSARPARVAAAERFFGIEVGRLRAPFLGLRLTAVARAIVIQLGSPTPEGHAAFLRFVDGLIGVTDSEPSASRTAGATAV